MMARIVTSVLIALLLWACEQQEAQPPLPVSRHFEGRWYSQVQVDMGRTLFQQNCASCHGDKAQSTVADWRQRTPEGYFPAPPLNGTAHTWHHPMGILKRTIREGGVKLGGQMPGFGQQISEAQQEAIIAYLQSYWDEEIYDAWIRRGGLDK